MLGNQPQTGTGNITKDRSHDKPGGENKMAGVEEELKQFDFVQLCMPDIHGIPRGKLMPEPMLAEACRDGVGVFSGRSLSTTGTRNTTYHSLPIPNSATTTPEKGRGGKDSSSYDDEKTR